MKTLILATTLAAGLMVGASEANAQGISFYMGGGSPYGSSYGLGYSSGYSGGLYAPSYGSYGGYGYGGSYLNNYRGPRNSGYIWHDTTHYDYVPTQVIPHGNHYHVQPGGYYLHQSGHVDRIHGNHIHHGH